MHLLSKRRGWSLFNILRTAIVFIIGLGLSLVSLVSTNAKPAKNFLRTPWQLPAITMSYLLNLILTHLPHPPRIFIKRSELDGMDMVRLREPESPNESTDSTHRDGGLPDNLHPPAKLRQPLTSKRGVTTMRNIRIERMHRDPVGRWTRCICSKILCTGAQ